MGGGGAAASQGQVPDVEAMDEAGVGRTVAAAGAEVRRGGVAGGAVAGAGRHHGADRRARCLVLRPESRSGHGRGGAWPAG